LDQEDDAQRRQHQQEHEIERHVHPAEARELLIETDREQRIIKEKAKHYDHNSERGHDPRGSTDRGVSGTTDEFRNDGVSALFAYGANQARGRLELAGSSYSKRYENTRASTQFADRDTDSFRGTAFFRVFPKTSLLAEYRHDDLDYKSNGSLLDSTEKRYLGGLTWEATIATSGTVKVGRLKKEFNSPLVKDFSGSNWEIAAEWKPLSYSKVDLFSTKTIAESTGVGDFVLSKRYGGAWTHNWTSRFSSVASYNFTDDEFTGNIRKDETDALGFKVSYKLNRVVTLGADLNYTKRDSNLADFNYTRKVILFTVGAAL